MRDFLVYASCDSGKFLGDFLNPCREFDVCVNDYTGETETLQAELNTFHTGHKWKNVASTPGWCDYRAYAFIDDDIDISAESINDCFYYGLQCGYDVWQPALVGGNVGWPHTRQLTNKCARHVPFVEIMMPFFSAEALRKCWHTFTENESGWGIDFLWPLQFENPSFAVLDFITARHTRPIQSETWQLSNGKTPLQECHELAAKYNLRGTQYGRFDQDLRT